jgi:hypothetical protein
MRHTTKSLTAKTPVSRLNGSCATRQSRAFRRSLERLEQRDLLAIWAHPAYPHATENTAFQGVIATFDDSEALPPERARDYQVNIDWGDNTANSSGTVSVVNGAFQITAKHDFPSEWPGRTYDVTVNIQNPDDTSDYGKAYSTVYYDDAPLKATSAAVSATAGTSFTALVASFTDGDPLATKNDYTATINWGDSTTFGTVAADPSTQGKFNVTGTHNYPSQGTYTVQVTIFDNPGGTSVLAPKGTATVKPPALPTLSPAGVGAVENGRQHGYPGRQRLPAGQRNAHLRARPDDWDGHSQRCRRHEAGDGRDVLRRAVEPHQRDARSQPGDGYDRR